MRALSLHDPGGATGRQNRKVAVCKPESGGFADRDWICGSSSYTSRLQSCFWGKLPSWCHFVMQPGLRLQKMLFLKL